MTYLYFIGIDVSKNTFDISFHNPQDKQKSHDYPNTPQGFTDFLGTIPFPNKTFIVLEATGGYETELLLFLHQNNVTIHRISPLKSSYYLRSVKTYAKNDVLDSQALAQIAFERHKTLPIFSAGSEKQRALYYLFSRKQDLVEMRKAEKQRLNHPNYHDLSENIMETIAFFDKKIDELEAKMQTEVDECQVLANIQKLLLSQKGVGNQVSFCIMASFPELGLLGGKQIASLAGVAPHPRESGGHKGYRSCRGGRQGVKRMLFMAGLSAVRYDAKLSLFYNGLRERGKKPKVALVASMRKLIVILNAKTRDLYSGLTLEEINAV